MSTDALAESAQLALAVFLLALAAVTWLKSRDLGGRGPLALFLALVGASYVLDSLDGLLLGLGLRPGPPLRLLSLSLVFLDAPVLLAYAFAVTRGPLPRRRLLILAAPTTVLLGLLAFYPPSSPFVNEWDFRGVYFLYYGAFYALAFWLILECYLAQVLAFQRERMAALVLAFGLVVLPRLALLLTDLGIATAGAPDVIRTVVLLVLVLALAYGATWAVAAARATDPRHARRTLVALGTLLLLVAGGWALLFVPSVKPAATALMYPLRWVLFAAVFSVAMRRFELLDMPEGAQRRVRLGLNATLLALSAIVLAVILTIVPGLGGALALMTAGALVLGGAVVRLAIRWAIPEVQTEEAWRRLALYRAHVEVGTPDTDLDALRKRLHIREADAREVRDLVVVERQAAASRPAEVQEGALLLGRYDVRRMLGAGTFGRTFVAWDRVRGARVVLKELLPAWREDPEALAAFRREAETVMRFAHPNLVAFHGVEPVKDGELLVLEHVEGETLRERLARGPLSEPEAARLALDLLAGLQALHEAGIVHRDVKPDNVILRAEGGGAVLLDFGAATAATGTVSIPAANTVGTRSYMSPEQVAGGSLDGRSDLYGLAVTVWEALAGALPPGGKVPAAWAGLLRAGMAPVPEGRPASTQAFQRALEGVLGGAAQGLPAPR